MTIILLIFHVNICCGAHWKRLIETLSMSTNNTCIAKNKNRTTHLISPSSGTLVTHVTQLICCYANHMFLLSWCYWFVFFFNFLQSIHVALWNLYSIFYEIRWSDCDKITNSPFFQEMKTRYHTLFPGSQEKSRIGVLHLLRMCTKKYDSEWDGVNNHGAW